MREIKFRGLRIDGKGWVYGYYWIDNSNGKHKITVDLSDDNFTCHEVTPESVGQFTGLKDKNGKEIYEMDVLRDKDGSVSYVIWDDAAFALKSLGSEAIDWVHSSEYETKIIIGNVLENKNLIS